VTFPSSSRRGLRRGAPRARERATWLSPSDASRPPSSARFDSQLDDVDDRAISTPHIS
jgi:hypothetical protein